MNVDLNPGINHIEFWVSDLNKSMEFYQNFLPLIGWNQISPASFSTGSMVIYFLEMKGVEKMN